MGRLPDVFLYRGIIYAKLGQPDRALADFKKWMDVVKDSRSDFFAIDDFVRAANGPDDRR
jgi:hypothetical protein